MMITRLQSCANHHPPSVASLQVRGLRTRRAREAYLNCVKCVDLDWVITLVAKVWHLPQQRSPNHFWETFHFRPPLKEEVLMLHMPPPIHLLLLYAAHQLMLYVRVYFSRSSSQMYYFGKYMPRLAAELRRRSKLIGPWFISKKIAAAVPTQPSVMNIPITLRFYVTKPLSNLYEFKVLRWV